MRVFTVIGHIFGYSLFGSNGKTKVFKHRRKSKQKTNRSDSSGAVRRLGTIIQRIFLCPITSWYLSNHLEMVWRHSLPKGVSISAWNFHRAVSHDPTDSPWTFEDVTRPPLTSSFKNGEVIWVIRISSGPTAARVARNWVNKSISKTQTSFHILHAVIYVRNKEQKQKQRNSEIYFGMNNSYVEKGCLPFDRKIRLGCPKQIKKYQNRYFLFMRVKYKEDANLWGGSLEPIQLVNGLVSVVQAPSSWYLGSKMVMCRPPFPIVWVVFSLTLFSLLSFESLAQARLQHSPYFCVFKYARTVKLNLERGWKRRAKLGLTLRQIDFEKKNPDCFAGSEHRLGPVQTPHFSWAKPNTLN